MSRQIQFLTDERTRWYVIQLQIGFNTLVGKKLHLKCGGSTEFELDDFFQQQYAALNDKEHFRQRQKEQLDSYNKEFYELKFTRIDHTIPYSHGVFFSKTSENIAKGATSFGMDLVPIVGQIKALKEVYSGVDPITGYHVSRILSAISIIPGGKIATKSFGWLKSTETAISGMKLIKQSTTVAKVGEGLKTSYTFIKSSKAVVGKHLANGTVGGFSSYTGSIATGDEHPYRSALIGSTAALIFGYKEINSFRKSINTGAMSGAVTNITSQLISMKEHEIEKFNSSKVIYNFIGGGLVSSLTYGAPLIPSLIISWGPSTAIGKVGDEVLK